jgi:hypothetical protein
LIEHKELPSEYVSIRQIWLKRIDDCGRAIGQRAIQEPNWDREERDIGDRTVCHTVNALYNTLVDYGEAVIRTEVDKYVDDEFNPGVDEIWKSKKDYHRKWNAHARISIKLYDCIIQTLNKYGMLFQEQPKGYSNVEMKSILKN